MPINRHTAHREAIAHSIIPIGAAKIEDIDSGREKSRKEERNGTNLRHLEHRWAAAIAISGPGKTGRFDKRCSDQDYSLAKHARMSGKRGRECSCKFLTANSII